MKQVTQAELDEAMLSWAKGPKHQRLGQFLMNELVPGETCSDVFHQDNEGKAYTLFMQEFVKEEM
jgi:hypothetical protein